ncbi:MAG TPA: hypothetical protein VN920_13670, partial [Pyrinomonadaceae bacterium]|nr:hypothetical protein [Pyrinomonadaceae bacterium]
MIRSLNGTKEGRQTAGDRQQVHETQTTRVSCLLPSASCRLLSAVCLLLAAFCLLPSSANGQEVVDKMVATVNGGG